MEKVEDHMGLVNKLAKRYHSTYKNKYDFDDLVQVGCIGLCKAIEDFNPELGFKFSTFAFPKIRGEITNLIRDDRFYPAHKKNRFDTSVNFVSLNKLIDEEGKVEIIDTLESCEGLDSISESLDLENALSKLPSLEKTIIDYYYFKDLTQAEIGKLLGITQSNVSKLLLHTLELSLIHI